MIDCWFEVYSQQLCIVTFVDVDVTAFYPQQILCANHISFQLQGRTAESRVAVAISHSLLQLAYITGMSPAAEPTSKVSVKATRLHMPTQAQ